MKKKNYLHLLAFAMVAMLCVGFTSCGGDDDDEDGGISKKALVGTWELVHKYSRWGVSRAGGSGEYESDITKDDTSYNVISFTADGIYHFTNWDWRGKVNRDETLSYSVSGSKLTLTDGAHSVEYNILTLTATTLIIEHGTNEYERLTYAKVE